MVIYPVHGEGMKIVMSECIWCVTDRLHVLGLFLDGVFAQGTTSWPLGHRQKVGR